MDILGVEAALLTVADRDQAARWYRDVLGLEATELPADRLEIDVGPVRIVLDDVGAHAGRTAVLVLTVADLDAALIELKERGITVETGLLDLSGRRLATLRDPSGNLFALCAAAGDGGLEEAERQISSFVDSAGELAGPPVGELADAVAAVVEDAWRAIGRLMADVPHNKVLATELVLSRRARGAEPGSARQWQLFASSTLLSDLVVTGA